jgi:Flp pilus assembly protein CpaB
MQLRNWLAIVAVLGCTFTPIGVAWMTVNRGNPPSTTTVTTDSTEDFVTVVIAHRSVPQGTFIKRPEDWFETQTLPRTRVSAFAVTSFDQAISRVLMSSVAKGHGVDCRDLVWPQDSVGGPLVPKPKHAMAIKVSHADCLAYQPGSRVCIENIIKSDSTGEEVKQIILVDMLLLATDPVDTSNGWEGSGPRSDTVTLQVTSEEAQVLALAQQLGTLRLHPASTE